jgi:protoporphyrinogen oxidase
MNITYDYIIIGGGPTGLTLAHLLSKYNKKVAIIEKEKELGGCHSVKRVDNLFSEHGPRIYFDNYLMFQRILKDIGYKFEDLFVPYSFGKYDSFNTVFSKLSYRELFHLGFSFLALNDSYKKISLMEFMTINNFSPKSIDLLDRLGRLTDGGTANEYTLHSFLQILNQNFLYKIYQPKLPNDVGFIKLWTEYLLNNGVDIYTGAIIEKIIYNGNKINKIILDSNELSGDNFIMAMPPYSIDELLQVTNLNGAFGNNFSDFSEKTNYLTYIPITFHWETKLNLKNIWGYPSTSWGIGHIVLSDYMDFKDDRSKTVISALITKYDKSEYLNKTPNQISDRNILIKEVFRQLKTIHKNLPEPDNIVMTQNYYLNNKWVPVHTAFMTTKYGYIDYYSPIFKNLYNCGVHNGKSSYSFTSLESSVVNAISLVHELVPESKNDYQIKEAITIRQVLFIILILCLLLMASY